MTTRRVKNIGFLIALAILLAMTNRAWALMVNVQIKGLDNGLVKHVQGHLDIYQHRQDSELTVSRLHRHHHIAQEQIVTALQVYGFYEPTIHAELKQDGVEWLATYEINPGVAMTLDKLDVVVTGEGQQDPVITKYLELFPLQLGQAVNHAEYDKTRNELLKLAVEQGFLDAVYSRRELVIDLKKYSATVFLHLESGQRYYFGPVHMQQDVMQDEFIQRYVRFRQGEPYSPAKLLRLQRELSDSGYYRTVEISPDRENAKDNQIPIDVRLTARSRHEWRFGIGYATDTGTRGSINHTSIVGDEGDRFEGRLLVSEKKQNILFAYTIPLADPVTEQLGFSIRATDETTDSRESMIAGATVSHTDSWREWQRVISLNYERERYIIGGEPEESKRITFPAISMTRITADDRLKTREGYRIYSELRGANENIFSDTNYGQLRLGLKWIHGLGDNSRILLRGDFGTTNVGELDKLPASQRFFAGGDNSVRGYAFEELGPVNELGEVIGGKHLLVGSAEIEQQIAGNWSAAAFYDIGNAINSFGDELYAGAGFGLRWHSPVGPIRFDFAWALDKEQDQFRLHVVIGPDL